MDPDHHVPNGDIRVPTNVGRTPVQSSAAHGWDGTLAIEIGGSPCGECRHNHQRVALQVWWQPLSVRPLRGTGSWRTVPPGMRVWLPGEEQYFEWRRPARSNVILMTPERIEQILERPYPQANLGGWRGLDFSSPFISRIVAAMSDDLANHCPAGPLVGDSLTAALIAHLAAGPDNVLASKKAGSPSSRGFDRALQYIEAHLERPLRMPELASEAGCNPKQLNQAFRARRGQRAHEYVLGRRVERAKLLIDGGGLSLARVAQVVGFADQSQLTKAFRKLSGLTPGRFRKRS